ncbi:MAG TPA: Ig-like domain-containing protein [Streptosporangiaceae bacterium]
MRGSYGQAGGRRGRFTSGRGRLAMAAISAAAALLGVAACSGSGPAAGGGKPTASHRASQAAATAGLTISPASGTRNADPGHGITVTASHGKIEHVTVHAGDGTVAGTLNQAGTVWRSQWALSVSKSYTVIASATNPAGQTVTTTSSFRTLTPHQTFQTQIFEGNNKTFGVGMPIMLTFSHPISDKAAVERALQVTTSKPVVGAWDWQGDEQLDFRPQSYWPAHTTVSFTGHLNGVQGAPGVYGYHTLTQTFRIGASLIVVASTASHHMSLYRDGHRIHYWSISTGRPGDNTPNGTYLTIDKGNPVDMKGPGYNIEVPWSVRFTWSGDYLHDAYWSVGEQGFTNVSHGCVNMAPANAQAYYGMEVPGDPVTVTGSPRGGTWGNGWTDWFLSWKQLLKGSALHEAVQAGPQGSKFVDPDSVPAANTTAPLQTSRSDNAAAA